MFVYIYIYIYIVYVYTYNNVYIYIYISTYIIDTCARHCRASDSVILHSWCTTNRRCALHRNHALLSTRSAQALSKVVARSMKPLKPFRSLKRTLWNLLDWSSLLDLFPNNHCQRWQSQVTSNKLKWYINRNHIKELRWLAQDHGIIQNMLRKGPNKSMTPT